MLGMKRILIVVVALLAGALPAAVLGATTKSQKKTTTTTTAKSTTTTTTSGPASLGSIGGTTVLGATKTPISEPTCATSSCNIVLTRASALETLRDGVAYPTKVKASGELVAFTVGLARIDGIGTLTAHQEIHDLDSTYGGVSLAGITVLKGGKGSAGNRPWTVEAVSPFEHLQPYLGYTVEFPLATPIQVTAGETVALTVPTWAPVLSYALNKKKFAYRQSRKTNCANAGSFEDAQTVIGDTTPYKCNYAGTRVEYDVTEILSAPAPKTYVHPPRKP
jgi:hypothetical protein